MLSLPSRFRSKGSISLKDGRWRQRTSSTSAFRESLRTDWVWMDLRKSSLTCGFGTLIGWLCWRRKLKLLFVHLPQTIILMRSKLMDLTSGKRRTKSSSSKTLSFSEDHQSKTCLLAIILTKRNHFEKGDNQSCPSRTRRLSKSHNF